MQGASYGCNLYSSFIHPFSSPAVLAKRIKANDNDDADDDDANDADDDEDDDDGPNDDDKARKGCN